jgi:hypothetical protein
MNKIEIGGDSDNVYYSYIKILVNKCEGSDLCMKSNDKNYNKYLL